MLRKKLSQKTTIMHDIAIAHLDDFQANAASWQETNDHLYDKDTMLCYKKQDGTGRQYEIWVDKKRDITSFVMLGNAQDKANGLVGTDGRAVVKKFGPNAYDYVTVDDFIDRQALIFKAALTLTNDNTIKENILKYQQIVLDSIRQYCDFGRMGKLDENLIEQFNEALAQAKNLMENSLIDLAYLMLPATERDTIEKMQGFMSRIKEKEIDIIRDQGRPFVIKTSDIAGQQMVSVQYPLGDDTIPSSDRSGKHKIKLSNHVRDGSGILLPDGKIILEVVIDGHSSYPPIHETDERKRRYVAYQAVEEKVSQLVKDRHDAGDKSKPMTVSIATIMMLTPMKRKNIEAKIRGKESEHNQLADTLYAVKMYCAKEKPIKIKVGNEWVEVNVDYNIMNFPVNVGRKLQNKFDSVLQRRTNRQGFLEFSEHINAFFDDDNQPLIKNALSLIGRMNNTSPVVQTMKAALNDKYRILNKLLKQLQNTPNDDLVHKQYAACQVGVIELEDKLAIEYKNLNQLKKDDYKLHQQEYNDLILNIRTQLKSDHNLDPADRKKLITMLRYLQSQKIYYEKQYLRKRHAYQFHINYILTNEMTEKDVEGFCKSAEDRTGWLRVSLLANLAFEKAKGYPPDLSDDNDKIAYYEIFAAKSLELSASIENNKYNSEARSLQVQQQFTNPYFDMQSGNLLSKLAKDVFPQRNFILKKLRFEPNSMMIKLTNEKGPSDLVKSLLPSAVLLAHHDARSQHSNALTMKATVRKRIAAPMISNPSATMEGGTASHNGMWENKRLFRRKQSVTWDVAEKNNTSSLVVRDVKNIEHGLLNRTLANKLLLPDMYHDKRLELAMMLVEAVVLPLRLTGAISFNVNADLPAGYEKLGSYIKVYCDHKGYHYQSNINPADEKIIKPISEQKIEKVAEKVEAKAGDQQALAVTKKSQSMLAKAFESMSNKMGHNRIESDTLQNTKGHKNDDKTHR